MLCLEFKFKTKVWEPLSPGFSRNSKYNKLIATSSCDTFGEVGVIKALDTEVGTKTLYHQETHNLNEQSVRLIDSSDEDEKDDYFRGIDSKMQFLSRMKDMTSNEKFKDSPHMAYLERCKEKGIVPVPYGMTKANASSKHLVLNNKSIGHNYADAFSEILPFRQTGFTLSLSNNRLTQESADKIVEKLNNFVHKLDLSNNSDINTLNFDKLIKTYSIRLTSLNVEGNGMGDGMIVKLVN